VALACRYDNVWFRIVVTKLLWLTWRAGIPLLVWRQSLGAFLGFFLITELFSGFWLAYNFQARCGRSTAHPDA